MMRSFSRFHDRFAAGRELGERLKALSLQAPVVYALPRGGVPVGVEIARALNAPLDLALVRKIGAPGQPELALGAVFDGATPQTTVNEDVRRAFDVDAATLAALTRREVAEIERRRALYFRGRTRIDPKGRTAIVVDDGLATGATARIALDALRRQGAARLILAAPVAPPETLGEMKEHADEIVCLHAPHGFMGVGAFYDDFHQLSDEETIALINQAPSVEPAAPQLNDDPPARREVAIPPLGLKGELSAPQDARGCVIFVHGSGSSRLSPRNVAVAEALNRRGFATLLFDLLTEEEARDRQNVFDIPLLADRLKGAIAWIVSEPRLQGLRLGLFGASTGAAAAIVAAAELGGRIGAIVSRGGRPDLAPAALSRVTAPTLLIVGGDDHVVLALNRQALAALRSQKALEIVEGATHLFEEPGALEAVTALASDWFERHLGVKPDPPGEAARR